MATSVKRGDLCIIETTHSFASLMGAKTIGSDRYLTFQLCEARSINLKGIVIRATPNDGAGFMVNKPLPQRVFALGNNFDHDAARAMKGQEWDSLDAAKAALAPYRNKVAA